MTNCTKSILAIISFALTLVSLHAQPFNFNGIVKLSNCSGAIIRLEKQSLGSKALVLTNGHCVQLNATAGGFQSFSETKTSVIQKMIKKLFALNRMLDPGEVIYNKLVSREMEVFNMDFDLIPVEAKVLLYATMTDTDLAIYELNTTYLELDMVGVKPFILSPKRPETKLPIHIISGYHEKGYNCYIDEFIPKLKEAQWIFTDSIRYTAKGCETIGGTSGSPIIQVGSRLVVGVNNTSNQNGEFCTLNNPCEIDNNGKMKVLKRSYGQQTYNVYSCINKLNKLDLAVPNCKLPKPKAKNNLRQDSFQNKRF